MKRQKSILIIEDETSIGEDLKEMLEPDYEEVVYSSSAIHAQDLVRGRPFSLILTDIQMPGMPGDEFVALVRSLGRIEPVVFVTGNATREVLFAAVRMGVSDVIEKPFRQEEILKTVERVLEIDKRRKALYENIFLNKVEQSVEERQRKMIGLLQVANLKK